jgi:hypothetical protein
VAAGRELGVVDRYQQYEIPPVAVTVTHYDQHAVACRCGVVHTATRSEGAAAAGSVAARTCWGGVST